MREILLHASLAGMIACAGLSLWPFRFARRWKSWSLYLPVAGLALYGVYELALREDMMVRWRMAVVVALLLFLWINGMAKVALLAWLQEKAGGSRRRLRSQPQRRMQILLALPVAAGCAFWFWKTLA
jgi:hypothetical protein